MMPLRPVAGFFIRCMLIYGLLIIPWTGAMDAYRWIFRHVGNALFYRVGSAGTVHFEKLSAADHARDTTLRLTNKRVGSSAGMDIKSVYTGYRPTIFMVALVLATPISWSRRGWALMWGLLWVSAFVAFRVWLRIVDAFSNDDVIAIYALGPAWKGAVQALMKILVLSPAPGYIIPAVIWMLVTIRRDDWTEFLSRIQPLKK